MNPKPELSAHPGPSLLTTEEVAQILRVSPRTVANEIAEGNLRPVRIRTSVRFTHEEINRYLSK